MQRTIVALLALLTVVSATRADDAQDIEAMRGRLIAYYTGRTLGPHHTDAATQAAVEAMDDRARELLARSPMTPEPPRDDPSDVPNSVNDIYSAVLTLAQAYSAPASSFYHSPQLKSAIEAQLERGYAWTKPGSERPGNWWYWIIGTPMDLGPALLLLDGHIDPDLHARSIDAMADLLGEPQLSGANAVWDARNRFYLGLLRRDAEIIDTAWDFLLPELTIHDSGMGILEDFSFQFHGALLHTSGYGGAMAGSAAELIYLSDDTRWSVPSAKRDLLARHLIEHARWVAYGTGYDLSVKGRGVVRNSAATPHLSALLLLSQVEHPSLEDTRRAAAEMLHRIDWRLPLRVAPLSATVDDIQTQPLTGFRFFPRSDFAVQRRPDWYGSVRMFSSRVIDYEGNWGTNLSGWFLTYGLTYFTRSGSEIYREREIMRELWDWDHLPGTTTRVGVHPPGGYNLSESSFAGGAGDGRNGLCGFILAPVAGDYTARKSVYFFDEGFAAAGSGITSTAPHPEPVVTTVTQWAAATDDAELTLSGDRTVGGFEGDRQWDNVAWAWYDGVGYIFPDAVTLHGHRRGPVLTLWLDHGPDPQDVGYAYIVLPTASPDETRTFAADAPIQVAQRDKEMHILGDKTTGATGIVFWEAGSINGFATDGPAVVYTAFADKGYVLAAQRPLRDAAELTIQTSKAAQINDVPTGVEVGRDEEGRPTIVIPTVAGRVYRIGAGGAKVQQPPRIEHDRWESFSVEAINDGWTTDLIITLPEPARGDAYRLQIRGSKGHLRKGLTDDDIVERLGEGRIRYRWQRDSESVRSDDLYVALVHGLHHVHDGFHVPDPGTPLPTQNTIPGPNQ